MAQRPEHRYWTADRMLRAEPEPLSLLPKVRAHFAESNPQAQVHNFTARATTATARAAHIPSSLRRPPELHTNTNATTATAHVSMGVVEETSRPRVETSTLLRFVPDD